MQKQYDEVEEAPRAALPRQGREAAARRRAAARRHEDGQGLRRGEAQDPARRQDGRPPRQQGRGVEDRADRGHAVPRGRHAGRHRAQPARRAEPHECRPDPRDPSRLGRRRPRPAGRRRRSTPTCKTARRQAAAREAGRRSTATTPELDDGRPTTELVETRPEPAPRRADRDAGLRRRQGGRHRAHAGEGGPRPVGPGRRSTTAAPASRSTAR